ncbi:MAG: MFS transporter [Proteobacteria bacterium]|nr:MFS transporter [Pseudomonadota bacterium]
MATVTAGGASPAVRRERTTELPPIGIGVRIAYGIGAIAPGVKGGAFTTFLLFYYSQVVGVPATIVSGAIAMTLFVDAICDPLIGRWSDVTRSRWGRRHPFMYGAIVPTALFFALAWFPPAGMSHTAIGFWIFFTAALTRMSLSAFEIAGNALAPELTDDYRERTRLFSLRYWFGYAGAYGFSAISLATFFHATNEYPRGQLNPDAYPGFALTSAALIALVIFICARGTHSRIPHLRQSTAPPRAGLVSHLREMASSFSNRGFLTIFGFGVFKYSAIGLYTGTNLFFGTYLWKLSGGQLAILTLGGLIAATIAAPLAPIASHRLGKRTSAMLFAILGVAWGLTPLFLALNHMFLTPGDPRLMPTLLFIDATYGAMVAISLINTSAMLADVVEDSAVKTGRRDSGTFFAAASFMQQCSTAIGIYMTGRVLAWSNFPDKPAPGTVTDDMVRSLLIHYIPASMGLWTVGALILCFYPITRARHEANLEILRAREAEAIANEQADLPIGGPMH